LRSTRHLLQPVGVLASGLDFRRWPLQASAKLLRSGRRLGSGLHAARPLLSSKRKLTTTTRPSPLNLKLSLFLMTAVATHLVMSFGQTFMHYKVAHHPSALSRNSSAVLKASPPPMLGRSRVDNLKRSRIKRSSPSCRQVARRLGTASAFDFTGGIGGRPPSQSSL
jgi:hypothetical protein